MPELSDTILTSDGSIPRSKLEVVREDPKIYRLRDQTLHPPQLKILDENGDNILQTHYIQWAPGSVPKRIEMGSSKIKIEPPPWIKERQERMQQRTWYERAIDFLLGSGY